MRAALLTVALLSLLLAGCEGRQGAQGQAGAEGQLGPAGPAGPAGAKGDWARQPVLQPAKVQESLIKWALLALKPNL
jgi:hypothetical protein